MRCCGRLMAGRIDVTASRATNSTSGIGPERDGALFSASTTGLDRGDHHESGGRARQLRGWGKRRFPNGVDDPSGNLTSQTTRGFTSRRGACRCRARAPERAVYEPLIWPDGERRRVRGDYQGARSDR
jgi:hypothetical protein